MIISKKQRPLHWTSHSRNKMRFYGLSESRIKRVISYPKRIEEGIAPDTIAMMQPAGSEKHPYEIWVMIQKTQTNADSTQTNAEKSPRLPAQAGKSAPALSRVEGLSQRKSATTEVISAWRYPGRTKPGQPLPEEIMKEIRAFNNI